MQQVTNEVTKYNSENVQNFMFPNLPKRVEILEREEFLFLPKDWDSNEELVVLNFIAQLRGYKIDYADNAPKHSIGVILQEIEYAIKQVANLELKDYAIRDRKLNLFYVRLIYTNIAVNYSIDHSIIGNRIGKKFNQINKYITSHNNLFRFDPVYRRMYNDVMQVITDNKII